MAPKVGARVGPFEILAPLGAGGMGEVYRASDPRLGRDVALKMLPATLSGDPDRIARFEREARATSALAHPNIVALYDIGTHEGAPYVVTELLEGETLRERLVRTRVSLEWATSRAIELARGLAAAHDRGIVHRDLKPENVFVLNDGHVKILDFGLAKSTSPVLPATDPDSPTHPLDTAPGAFLGTPGYMSPEQVRGHNADHRADIFLLGLVLYEMLAGRRAFTGETAVEVSTAILKESPPPFSELGLTVPASLERIVRRCLEKRPAERFQSAHDLAFHLEEVALATLSGRQGALSTTASGRTDAGALGRWRPRLRSLRRLWAPALACTLLGALLGVLGLGLWRAGRTTAPELRRITFRRGTVENARFSSDGQTVVYSASWSGAPLEAFSLRLGSPESRPLGFVGADVLALSRGDEMALSLERRRLGTFFNSGTLARAALGGGSSRPVERDIWQADWSPSGELAVVRGAGSRCRLELPLGHVLYETGGWISEPRVSPDGQLVAFADHPVVGDDAGHVAVVDRQGKKRRFVSDWSSVAGIAWPPTGREVWFTAARRGAERALRAVSLDGAERVVARMAGVLSLHDIARDGRVLLAHHMVRREIEVFRRGESAVRDLSWLDYSFPADLSADGAALLFAENGDGGGANYAAYTRATDGPPAVRLGEGAALALSADGLTALAVRGYGSDAQQLVLLPTGVGEPRLLPPQPVRVLDACFFATGERLLLNATSAGQGAQMFLLDLATGALRPIAPEGVTAALWTNPLSPDDRWALLRDNDGRYALYAVEGLR